MSPRNKLLRPMASSSIVALTAQQAAVLEKWASEHDPVIAVWLFGSRARGDHRADSDYDIALELAPKRDSFHDPAFTAFFFGYDQWKKQIAELLGSSISLVCYREDIECKFDPRISLIWRRISVSTVGTTRSPVVVIGPVALKFARDHRGRACNLYEADLYRTSNQQRRALLCPVLWVASHGAILAMRAAVPLQKMMSVDEYLEMGSRWRDAATDLVPDPFEPGARNWGILDGRLVAIDYAIQACASAGSNLD